MFFEQILKLRRGADSFGGKLRKPNGITSIRQRILVDKCGLGGYCSGRVGPSFRGFPAMHSSPVLTLRFAEAADLPFILDLAKKDPDALGFVPREAVSEQIEGRQCVVAVANGDLVGYVLHGKGGTAVLPIVQAAVIPDARRERIASALVDRVKQRAGKLGCQEVGLACAADLVGALAFWRASGFRLIGSTQGGATRGRLLNVFKTHATDPTQPALLGLPDIVGPGRKHASGTAARLRSRLKPALGPSLFGSGF
jgi:GNAT superfamily N-acetyltransferase